MKPNQTKPNHIYLMYNHKEDLALDNLQGLICHKAQPNTTKPNRTAHFVVFLGDVFS